MIQFRAVFALMGIAATLALTACARHHHGSGHEAKKSGVSASAAFTAPAKVTVGVPALTSGYQKLSAPTGATVYFANLRNGMVVDSPVKVVFGLTNMGVAPAGVERGGTGHHHLLIDVSEWDANAPLPANDNFRHFGGGQTETSVELKPGQHTLQLVLGDHNHIPHFPAVMSERITITVR